MARTRVRWCPDQLGYSDAAGSQYTRPAGYPSRNGTSQPRWNRAINCAHELETIHLAGSCILLAESVELDAAPTGNLGVHSV